MSRRASLLLLLAVGCDSGGSKRLQVPTFDIDGHRQQQFSRDTFGTRYYYDSARNEPCTPQLWSDGSTRCTPLLLSPYNVPTTDTCPIARISSLSGSDGSAPTSASDLVEITSSVTGGGRLGLSIHAYASGKDIPFALYDSQAGSECRVLADLGGSNTCSPTIHYSSDDLNEYEDDACATAPVMALVDHCPRVSNVAGAIIPALLTPVDAHPTHVKLAQHSAGPPLPCTTLSVLPGVTYFRAGTNLALVQITRQAEMTSDRIRTIYLSDGTTQLADGLYDSTLDAECVIRLVRDGSYRCVPGYPQPPRPVGQQPYGDAQCTQPIDIVDSDAFLGDLDGAISVDVNTAGTVTRLRARGTPYSGPIYYLGNSQCYPSFVPMFTPGADIAFADLAEGTPVQE